MNSNESEGTAVELVGRHVRLHNGLSPKNGGRSSVIPHWLTCPHAGNVLARINGQAAGCGCATSTAEVYLCDHFNEPVLKRAATRCLGKIRETVPGYNGQTCRECKVPGDAMTILHITFRNNWQDQIRRSEFALKQHTRTVRGVEVVRPDEKKLEAAIQLYKPDIVINHGFCLRYDSFLPVVERYPDIAFVTVDHSNQNHTFTWPQYFTDEKNVLLATEKHRNIWYASPDAYGPWNDLGYKRYFHWPNPVCLPPAPTLPAAIHDPPTLAIVGRCDWMKAFPVQVAAAALVQRRRSLRVVFVFRDSEERQKGLREHARACRLEFETHPWSDAQAWERWLRDECDVVSQSTFSDSFNYVSIDGAAFGRPWVGSHAIRHTPPAWRVDNPNDTYEVAAKIEWLLDHYDEASLQARQIAEDVAERNNADYATAVTRMLETTR